VAVVYDEEVEEARKGVPKIFAGLEENEPVEVEEVEEEAWTTPEGSPETDSKLFP
jgi:hypothetical protein